ncbi:MAG: hypothetical protein ACKVPX_15680 [Myxococcaceae bacterium]
MPHRRAVVVVADERVESARDFAELLSEGDAHHLEEEAPRDPRDAEVLAALRERFQDAVVAWSHAGPAARGVLAEALAESAAQLTERGWVLCADQRVEQQTGPRGLERSRVRILRALEARSAQPGDWVH